MVSAEGGPNQIEHIFEPLSRFPAARKKEGGRHWASVGNLHNDTFSLQQLRGTRTVGN